jgi:hypothetical protein
VGCNNFLTGGETSTDPNRQIAATNNQYFVSTEENLWAYWGSDPARLTGILAQQFHGVANQYGALEASYAHDQSTTNGTHAALYTGGGLVDIKKLQAGARVGGDSLYVGVAQIEEGALMGTGADVFGDLVYSQALQGIKNPQLDDQFKVYDSVQKVISAGIANVNTDLPTNVGPAGADLNAILFTNGLFLAVGDKGTILTSTNSRNWEPKTSSTGKDLKAVAYGASGFIAVGDTAR